MILLDGKETRQINVLYGNVVMTYLFDIDLKKYNLLKKELISKYGVERQINRHDVLLGEKSLLEIIYEEAIHNNKYGSIEIQDYCSYNAHRVSDDTLPLYGRTLTSYAAYIRDIPAICVAADLTLHDDLISLEYFSKYLKQFNDTKEHYNEKNNVVYLDLLRNNNFNINIKERKITQEELTDIILSIMNCFKVVGKYAQCLNNLNNQNKKIATINAKAFELLLDIISKDEKEKVLTLGNVK